MQKARIPKLWVGAGLAFVSGLLVLSTFVSYYNLAGLASAQDQEEEAFQTRWSLVKILALLSDAETGQRGYIITGDETFLAQTEQAFQALPVELENLSQLLPHDAESDRQFTELNKLVVAKLRRVRQNISARRENGFAAAEREVAAGTGRAAMEAIRDQIGMMDARELRTLRMHGRETDAAAKRAQVIIVAANLLACVTAGFSADQVRRGFDARTRAKAAVDQANAELEMRVKERTAELRLALTKLEQEIQQRRSLEAQVLQVSEREQRRIAEDLHDGQGQLLAGALHLVSAHVNRLSAAGLEEAKEAQNLKQLIREALEQTRSVVRGLYPVKMVPKGFALALQDLASRTSALFDLHCEFRPIGSLSIEDHTLATNLFRIAQEAVTNAARHAACTRIRIEAAGSPGKIEVAVLDNGKGMPHDWLLRSGLGIRMMRYRAELIGATLAFREGEGLAGGTKVVCSIALPNDAGKVSVL